MPTAIVPRKQLSWHCLMMIAIFLNAVIVGLHLLVCEKCSDETSLIHEARCCAIPLVLFVVFALKSWQIAVAIPWVYQKGEEASLAFRDEEARLDQMTLDGGVEEKREKFREYRLEWIKRNGPRWSLFGLMDYKFLNTSSFWYWWRELAFRFKSTSLLGSMFLVFTSPANKQFDHGIFCDRIFIYYNSPHCWILSALGVCLLLNCFLMSAEILIGKATMGHGYAKYYHLDLGRLFVSESKRKRHLIELWDFSRLAMTTCS